MVYMMYDVDISDADELFYRQQVMRYLGIVVLIRNLSGPGGGNPQCTLIGRKEDLIEYCEDEDLGFGDSYENLGLDIEELDLKLVDSKNIIRGVFI